MERKCLHSHTKIFINANAASTINLNIGFVQSLPGQDKQCCQLNYINNVDERESCWRLGP